MSRKTVRADLVRAICAYTKAERRDGSDAGDPVMVDAWLEICRLCRRVESATVVRAAVRGGGGRKRRG